jgi:2-desacetyl-2-hydroxyethyl bacteriochlorophyllide A dehydrogenase
MLAARVHQPGQVELDEVDRPSTGHRDVLVKVERCGICGSDLSYVKMGGIPGAAKPFAIGHEFAGTVSAVGEAVSHIEVGDRVVVNPEGARNGIGSAGYRGAFAPYLLFENAADDPGAVIRLPEKMDFDLGALVEPLSVGMNGVVRGQVEQGDKVVVFGAGPVGLGAALVARYFGAESVVVTDLSEKRLAIAGQLGLDTFQADSSDIEAFLKDRHGVVELDPLLGDQSNTDVYIEATGVGPVFEQILGLARKNARVVLIGVHFAPVELNMVNLLLRQLSIIASMAYSNEIFSRVVEMLESGAVDPRPMITHHFPLSQFGTAFEQACRADEAVKVLVDCQQ